MILLRNIKLRPGDSESQLAQRAASALRIPRTAVEEIKIIKKSLDARKKPEIFYIYSVAVSVEGDEEKIIARSKADASVYTPEEYSISQYPASAPRPLVVGFGPAGMFAALSLARAGAKPVVIERGQEVHKRTAAVELFRSGGPLNPESNVQFGEGGAGTFSDGKLNTGTHDRRIAYVLDTFARFGAPDSVRYDAKPHIGTDVLVSVVENIRNEIIALGGEVRFETKFISPLVSEGRVTDARLTGPEGEYTEGCEDIILAIGHSARDTFENLLDAGIPMERKAFSMGARIEHLQADINAAQYGSDRKDLPPADYSLSVHLPDGSSAYTFCMCPGGYVFAAASEEGGVCTNGMSYSGRGGTNSNAALLVTLKPEDFPGEGVLAGMRWQREIEQRAFEAAGEKYSATSQRVGDFLAGTGSLGPGRVEPTYKPGVVWGSLDAILPESICSVMREAIPALDRRLKGFADPDAVLTAPETRSSSPVRIIRNEKLVSEAAAGLYPCGEGAGYAGGITSAAVDGLRCAEALIKSKETA